MSLKIIALFKLTLKLNYEPYNFYD